MTRLTLSDRTTTMGAALVPRDPVADHLRLGLDRSLFESLEPGGSSGFFRFGPGAVCYGRALGDTHSAASANLADLRSRVEVGQGSLRLPFDLKEVVDNLRFERYAAAAGRERWIESRRVRDVYYALRPILPVSIRRHLQKVYLGDWESITFPGWPIDRSVDALFESLLSMAIRELGIARLPFIWFWPEGSPAAAMMTHDVETASGRDFSTQLLDIDDEFGIPAAFQIVPEMRYEVPEDYLAMLRARGAEINLQGLDHTGGLFADRESFLVAAGKIKRYAEQFQAAGFRSPALYRNVEWLQDLSFAYDMSVPNTARLEPQRGGCCTLMPYFLPGGTLELPLTTIEDYTLFHVLGDYSANIWRQQMDRVLDANGLMSFVVHPDYIRAPAALKVYRVLLGEIVRLRSERGVWVARPGEINRWWRARSAMELVPAGDGWAVQGPGSDQARVAYARLVGDALVYELD